MMDTARSMFKRMLTKAPMDSPRINPNYNELPNCEVSYPTNDIRVQKISPYDEGMKELLASYFPSGVTGRNKPGHRPNYLSLQVGRPSPTEWNKGGDDVAFARCESLYENNGSVGQVGDPVADCCAVVLTRNTAIVACADGCGWGSGASDAARRAVLSMTRHLLSSVLNCDDIISDSRGIFEKLSAGVNEVQRTLIEHGGPGLTTLSTCIILPLKQHSDKRVWVVCNVKVGDTSTYRYSNQKLTPVSDLLSTKKRDMRDCGGCLGPSHGTEPDLENMTFSICHVESDGIVFLSTDGVSDNFNPYVTNQLSRADPKTQELLDKGFIHKAYCSCEGSYEFGGSSCDLRNMPQHRNITLSAEDLSIHGKLCDCTDTSLVGPGQLCSLLEDILSVKYFEQTLNSYYFEEVMLYDFCISILRMIILSTEKKRVTLSRYRSRCDSLTETEITQVNRCHRNFVKSIPGKLDHASIAAVHLTRMNKLDSFRTVSGPGVVSTSSPVSGFGNSLSLTRSAEGKAPERNVRRLSRTKTPSTHELTHYQYQRRF